MKQLMLICIFFSLLNINEVFGISVPLHSGIYKGLGSLYLVEKGNHMEGYYQAFRGEKNNISTVFYFVGVKATNREKDLFFIKAFYPDSKDTINGVLQVLGKDQVMITLKSYPPGREFGLDGLTDTFHQVELKKWSHIAYINCRKVLLLKTSIDKSKRGRYLNQFDCIALKEKVSDSLEIECIGVNGMEAGFVKRSCVTLLGH